MGFIVFLEKHNLRYKGEILMHFKLSTPNRAELSLKPFIFLTFFYTFYLSICNKISFIPFLSVIMAIAILIILCKSIQISMRKIEIFTFICLFLLSLCNIVLFGTEVNTYILVYLFCLLPMMFAGIIVDLEKYHSFIYKISVVYVIFLLAYLSMVYLRSSTVHTDFADFMGFAYYVVPALLIITYNYFKDRKIFDLIMMGIGGVYLIICGTRGPLLCVIVFGAFCVFMDIKAHGNSKRKLAIIGILLTAAFAALNLRSISLFLYPIFQRYGFSTRFFQIIISGNSFTVDTGRNDIYSVVMENIGSHPITGTGLFSDRMLFGGDNTAYSHNFILEIINSFGIPVGCLLLFLLFALIIYSFSHTKSSTYQYYIAIYVSAAIVKLTFSSSFMQESTFFILIGICFAALRHRQL